LGLRERKLNKLYSAELHNLNSSADVIRMIKSIRMRLVGHAAYGKKGNPYRVLVEISKEKRCLKDIDTDGMTTLKQFLGIG
jgi:hypothetical protein